MSDSALPDLQLTGAPQFYFCEVGWNWSPRPLLDYDLWFVASGRGTMRCKGQQFDLRAGRGFVWRPGDAPVGSQDENHRLVVFAGHFEPLTSDDSSLSSLEFPFPLQVRDTSWFETLAHRIESLWRRDEADSRREATQLFRHLLWQLRDEWKHPLSTSDVAFHEMTAAIRREPARVWNLDEMARGVHLSRAQFVRRFRAVAGTSPADFVLQTRLERARQLLLETEMTQAQIARALGFCDAAHLSRAFARRHGRPPGSLRSTEEEKSSRL